MRQNNGQGKWMTILTFAVIATMTTACGKKKTTDEVEEQSQDSDSLVIESAVASLGSAVNDSEQSPDYSSASMTMSQSCGLSRFSPAIGLNATCSGSVENRTVLANFANCTAGKNDQFLLNGEVWLQFDSPATCDEWINAGALPVSGSVVRTTNAFVRTNPGNSYVTTSSNSHKNYKDEDISGGVRTSFTAGGGQVEILGLQRILRGPGGRIWFNHSLRTAGPLIFSGNKATSERRLESGEVLVDHNILKATSTVAFSGLVWDNSCCHPINGSVTLSSTLMSNNIVADFNTGVCGTVKLTGPNGSQNVQLSVCE